MNESPQKENGYIPIACEIAEVLCCINLSPYESRVLWCIFRKTYGWNKKEDWISLGNLTSMTGMLRQHVSKAKQKLIKRKIVTQTGYKIAFNKYHSQWLREPKQVIVTQIGTSPQIGTRVVPKQVIGVVPVQGLTIDNITIDTITKDNLLENKKIRQLQPHYYPAAIFCIARLEMKSPAFDNYEQMQSNMGRWAKVGKEQFNGYSPSQIVNAFFAACNMAATTKTKVTLESVAKRLLGDKDTETKKQSGIALKKRILERFEKEKDTIFTQHSSLITHV